VSNDLYWHGLYIGGGMRWETLEVIEAALRQAAESQTGPVHLELMDTANACYAQLTKRPKPVCDLI
jgi:hypothetical protein